MVLQQQKCSQNIVYIVCTVRLRACVLYDVFVDISEADSAAPAPFAAVVTVTLEAYIFSPFSINFSLKHTHSFI